MNYTTIILSALLVIWFIYRQLTERPVKEDRPATIIGILGIAGIIQSLIYLSAHSVTILGLTVTIASMLLGVLFGIARGYNAHLWRDAGILVRKGNWITLVLWIVGIAFHLLSDSLAGHISPQASELGSASILLYMSITLASQRFILLQRGKAMESR